MAKRTELQCHKSDSKHRERRLALHLIRPTRMLNTHKLASKIFKCRFHSESSNRLVGRSFLPRAPSHPEDF